MLGFINIKLKQIIISYLDFGDRGNKFRTVISGTYKKISWTKSGTVATSNLKLIFEIFGRAMLNESYGMIWSRGCTLRNGPKLHNAVMPPFNANWPRCTRLR